MTSVGGLIVLRLLSNILWLQAAAVAVHMVAAVLEGIGHL
jgi:hypothetical protein